MVLAALALSASWTLLGFFHFDDLYRVDHAAGVWMGLAKLLNGGTFYPPVDGPPYGATRYAPLPIAIHAGLARLTEDYVIAGRAFGIAATLFVIGLSAAVLRRHGVPWPAALLPAVIVLATEPGIEASLGLRHEALPAGLQIAAVAAVANHPTAQRVIGAAGLSALALAAKLSALWAPVAILLWLLLYQRRLTLVFGGAFLACCALVLGLVTLLSDGRFVANLAATLGPEPLPGGGWLPGLPRLIDIGIQRAPLVVVLLPLALAGISVTRPRTLTIWEIALLTNLGLLVAVFADRGAFGNHLLDLVVLTAIVATLRFAKSGRRSVAGRLLTVALLVGAVSSFSVNDVGEDVWSAVHGRGTVSRQPLAGVVNSRATLLSESPVVPVALGRVPVVIDPFMLRRLAAQRPAAVAPLVAQIEAREFVVVATLFPLAGNRHWYTEYHFGVEIYEALLEHYEHDSHADGFYVYRPRS